MSQPSQQPLNGTRFLLIPSAGMGHLVPFVRLAAALSSRGIAVSLLAGRPTASAAESRLLSSIPASLSLDFPLAPLDPSLFPPSSDPFYLHSETLRRSSHLLPPLLSTTHHTFSALIVDISVASSFLPVAAAARVPCFVLFTSSASMLALYASFPYLTLSASADIDIAGVFKIPDSSLPSPLCDPNNLFTTQLVENSRALPLSDGILVNTFSSLEPEVLAAFKSGEVVCGLPPVIALGPLPPERKQPSWQSPAIRWLDEQPERSVIYVSFGSRTTMSRPQIKELGTGLEMSGCRFFWVIKSSKVDREETGEIEDFVGEGYMTRVEGRGLVVREWVEQDVVLNHLAVAVFLSHCGWNSVMEAAVAGVRVLAWPRRMDQRVNAALVAKSRLGVWPEEWAWEAEEGVVAAEEIAKKVKEVMEDVSAGKITKKWASAAAAAVAEGGSSDVSMSLFGNKIFL